MEFDRPREGRRDAIDDLSLIAIAKRKLVKKKQAHVDTRKRLIIVASSLGVVLGIAGAIGWKLLIWQPAVTDPFSTQLSSSLQFPLFHPTYIPAGFHVDTKSVTEPATGVVVFALDGPNNKKIYISEEARPAKFDIGGFFAKFSNLKESAIPGGTLASGKINSGQTEISSMLTNQDWIICNTSASVPMDQMSNLAKDLTSNVAPQ